MQNFTMCGELIYMQNFSTFIEPSCRISLHVRVESLYAEFH